MLITYMRKCVVWMEKEGRMGKVKTGVRVEPCRHLGTFFKAEGQREQTPPRRSPDGFFRD